MVCRHNIKIIYNLFSEGRPMIFLPWQRAPFAAHSRKASICRLRLHTYDSGGGDQQDSVHRKLATMSRLTDF